MESKWSELPMDLLTLILTLLLAVLSDYIAFGQVCRWWRFALLRHRRLRRPPPLLLTTLSSPWFSSDDHLTTTYSLFCSTSPRQYRKLAFELRLGRQDRLIQCSGTSSGWLLINSPSPSSTSNNYLLNPVTRHRIYLPRIDHPCFLRTAALSSSPNSSNCIVVMQAICYRPRAAYETVPTMLAWWRPSGHEQWTWIYRKPATYGNMAFHMDRLYILGSRGYTLVYDFAGRRYPKFLGWIATVPAARGWFVESDGELLMVAEFYSVRRFQVFRLEGGRWTGVVSLGDRVLLVSDRSCESLSTTEFMGLGFRRNCVYSQTEGINIVLVYSLEDSKCRAHPLPHGRRGVHWLRPRGWY